MGFLDFFVYGFGFSVGANATNVAINSAEEAYRKKYFDAPVQEDIKSIVERGILENRVYPFPTSVKTKRPPFFVRHKFYCSVIVIIWVLIWLVMTLFGNNVEFAGKICIVLLAISWFFGVGGFIVMLIKKIARGGKKVADFTFQSTYISEGQEYWNIREQVRQALQAGTINSQNAVCHLRNTALGRRLPNVVQ